MKRVGVVKWRNRTDYIGVCGHRLVSLKLNWVSTKPANMGGDCPKCPDEPEPAKVECAHITKPYGNDPWWTYCPRCGVRLPEA